MIYLLLFYFRIVIMEVRKRVTKVIAANVTKKVAPKKKDAKSNPTEKQEPSTPVNQDDKLSLLRHAAQLLCSTGMKIGYPCICTSLCTANHIFRLSQYTNEKCIEVTDRNLTCLQKILEYNVQHGFYFFRISSQTVPFASHPVCTIDWAKHFSSKLRSIGQFIKDNDFRISMHPDQFCLINAKDEKIIDRSIAELDYHCRLLDGMELDSSAKIQIHVGGIYGDKKVILAYFSSCRRKLMFFYFFT